MQRKPALPVPECNGETPENTDTRIHQKRPLAPRLRRRKVLRRLELRGCPPSSTNCCRSSRIETKRSLKTLARQPRHRRSSSSKWPEFPTDARAELTYTERQTVSKRAILFAAFRPSRHGRYKGRSSEGGRR